MSRVSLLTGSFWFLTLAAPVTAYAGVAAEWGGFANILLNGVGLRCGQVGTVIETIDSDYECTLSGVENTFDRA